MDYNGMAENYINGNKSDFKYQVLQLTPIQIIHMIEVLHGRYNYTHYEAIEILRNCFK